VHCAGIGYAAMSQLMSNVNITNFLCLRETTLTDGALCNFVGSSLEFLDISETVVWFSVSNYMHMVTFLYIRISDDFPIL
jgi:hypothetical protein